MTVRILRSTVADGRDVFAGEVHDLSERDAAILIRMGKAVADEPRPVPQPTKRGKAK